MLDDGSRHNIVGVIDVYSRRLKLLVSNSSNSKAVTSITRACLLEWGVPEEVKTDNGADYASKHMRRVFDSLEIKQIFCKPFTPEGKPHIERVFKTFSHDVLEMLPGYIGHNVSDRKNIEARKSFADHIMGKAKNRTAEYLSAEQLQEFCDNWIKNYYMQEPHRGLNGKTPQSMIDNYDGEVRRIGNERALDILLSPTSGDGLRTVTKKASPLIMLIMIVMIWQCMPVNKLRFYILNRNGEKFTFSPWKVNLSAKLSAANAPEFQEQKLQQLKSTCRNV